MPIAVELFGRLGVKIELHRDPAERSLISVNDGKDDGTLSRIAGLEKRYPNLVQFTEPVRSNDFSAFTKRGDIHLSGWADLAPYHVGHISGWKIVERNLPEVRSITRTRNVSQLMRLLDVGRIDIAIVNRWGGLSEVKQLGLRDIRVVEPPLATRQMYFYLHRRHTALLPAASAMLKTMKQDGSWQRIYDEKVAKYLAR